MDAELAELLGLARRAAALAGEIVMPLYERRLTVELKADGTPVTEADRRVLTSANMLLHICYSMGMGKIHE